MTSHLPEKRFFAPLCLVTVLLGLLGGCSTPHGFLKTGALNTERGDTENSARATPDGREDPAIQTTHTEAATKETGSAAPEDPPAEVFDSAAGAAVHGQRVARLWGGRFHIVYPYPMTLSAQTAGEVLAATTPGLAAPSAPHKNLSTAARTTPETRQARDEAAASPQAKTPDETSAPVEPANPPADLWDRIRAGFAIEVPRHPRVAAERKWYASHPEYMKRTMKRARPYLHLIVEALAQRDMPMEIALLPIVESAFQPFAYSHGRAAGIWQFIPGTARHYGLKQNWWYDGRRDIQASTRAALDYLQYLHRTFDGDWLLALAAYNSGSGTVKNAVRKNRRRGKGTDFWSLRLPRETRAYVPKLLALSEIVAAPEKFGLSLAPIPDKPFLVAVDTGSQIDLALAAELAGLSLDEIYRYNPGFNRWATDPDGPHRLLLPVQVAENFRHKLARLPAEKRIKWIRHKIREGETLGHLARRYGTTVSVLKQVNGIKSHLIRAGRSMLIPVATRDLSAYRLSEEQRRRAIQNRRQGGQRIVHTVRKGDTWWDLARKYRVGMRQLARWNGMAPRDLLRPGQKLVIWKKGGARPGSVPGIAGLTRRIHYTVRKGDSLARISQKFKVTVSELRMWNDLPKGKYLQPGQKLTLYVDVTRQTGG